MIRIILQFQTAKEQDYDAFYKQEIAYRRMLAYPPVWQLLLIHCTGTDPQVTTAAARDLAEFLHRVISQKGKNIMLVGIKGRCIHCKNQ